MIPFEPYDKLLKRLEFVEMDYGIKATICGEFIGECRDPTYGAVEEWKERIKRAILVRSSTTVLRTACGCERTVNIDGEGHRSYIIPLMPMTMSINFGDPPNTESAVYKVREFRWEHRFHESGARLFEEVL